MISVGVRGEAGVRRVLFGGTLKLQSNGWETCFGSAVRQQSVKNQASVPRRKVHFLHHHSRGNRTCLSMASSSNQIVKQFAKGRWLYMKNLFDKRRISGSFIYSSLFIKVALVFCFVMHQEPRVNMHCWDPPSIGWNRHLSQRSRSASAYIPPPFERTSPHFLSSLVRASPITTIQRVAQAAHPNVQPSLDRDRRFASAFPASATWDTLGWHACVRDPEHDHSS